MKRTLIALLTIGLLSACAGVMAPAAARSESPKQSLQSTQVAMAKVQMLRFDASGTATMTLPQAVVAQLKSKAGSQGSLLSSTTAVSFKATGLVKRPDQLDANLSATIGGLTITTEVIAVGGHLYYKDPMTQKWELAKRPTGQVRAKAEASAIYERVLDTAKSLTEVSAQPSSLDGVAVDEYRIVLDLGTLFAQIEGTHTPKNPQALPAIQQLLQNATVTANVWTGTNDRLVRRVVYDADVSADLSQLASVFGSAAGSTPGAFTLPAGSTAHLTAHLEVNLHDYNSSVTISAPTIGS